MEIRDAYSEEDIPLQFPRYDALRDFDPTPPLSRGERLVLVHQAMTLLARFYVHLPTKAAVYGVDPVAALGALGDRVRERRADDEPSGDDWFHDEMTAIFTSLRDRHTTYTLPNPYRRAIACLPFLIERCRDASGGGHRYVVTKASPSLTHEDFRELRAADGGPRIEVVAWNGIPIERAVQLNGALNAGGNRDARLARGLERLSFRWLGLGSRPPENWVLLTYVVRDAGHDEARTLRFPWLLATRRGPEEEPSPERAVAAKTAAASARDEEGEWIGSVKRALLGDVDLRWGGSTEDLEAVPVPGAEDFGYLRIHSFDEPADGNRAVEQWLERARAQIGRLDRYRGLLIDLRGNPGGLIGAAEGLLERLCPEPIEREGLQFRNTPEVSALAERYISARRQAGGMAAELRDDARAAGAPFLPSPPLQSGAIGRDDTRLFQGPVAVIIDSLTYSAAEIFAAGFQDADRGVVVGTARRTGGGGANVWPYELVSEFADSGTLVPLPRDASFSVAMRRVTRVGPRAGLGLEDLGVATSVPPHDLTAADLLDGNIDLKHAAIAALLEDERRRGVVSLESAGADRFNLRTARVDRVDIYLDGRPYGSRSVDPGGAELEVTTPTDVAPPQSALFQGFRVDGSGAPVRVAAYRWDAPRDGGAPDTATAP